MIALLCILIVATLGEPMEVMSKAKMAPNGANVRFFPCASVPSPRPHSNYHYLDGCPECDPVGECDPGGMRFWGSGSAVCLEVLGYCFRIRSLIAARSVGRFLGMGFGFESLGLWGVFGLYGSVGNDRTTSSDTLGTGTLASHILF